jgi:hypothetical protein
VAVERNGSDGAFVLCMAQRAVEHDGIEHSERQRIARHCE